MTVLMLLHITLGCIAILSGFVGILSKKGQTVHRTAGKIFVVSMVSMASIGSFIAYMKPEMITVLAGVFTSYLVISAFITVRTSWMLTSWPGVLMAALAFIIGAACIYFGYQASVSTNNQYHGFPAATYYFFGGLALLAMAFDVKILIQKSISGTQKITRHAWRMSFALLMASSSLFDGPGANSFPDFLQGSPILLLPQGLVAALMTYWLIRMVFIKSTNFQTE